MEFALRPAVALLLITTLTIFCRSSAAPAVEERSKRSSEITDAQIVQLKNLLARLRAENEEHSHASVEKSSNQQNVKEGQEEEEEQQQQLQHSHADSAVLKPQSRAVSAEDMRNKDMDIVEQLTRLDKADTAQILARALSKLKQDSSDFKEKEESQEKLQGGSNSAGDDMGTLNNGEEIQDEKETKQVDKTLLLEALIKESLAKLDRDNDDKPRSLFHPEPRNLPRKNKERPVKEPLDQQIERYLDLMRTGDKGESEENTAEEPRRQKELQIVESRLMRDIHMANMFGVSVEDLIRDLEEKAYIEANAKRIGELLDMHEQGRDEK